MIRFQKLTLKEIKQLKPYFQQSGTRACDNTVGGTFMWRDYFHTEYTFFDGTVIFKVRYLDGRTAFCMPLGADVPGALREIGGYCREQDIPMVLCTVTGGDLALLRSLYEIDVRPEPDWSDYLYNAEDLAFMKGKRFNGQRNHMNRFRREFPDYSYAPLSRENIPAVRDFFEGYGKSPEQETPIYFEERNKVFEVLEQFETYEQTGLVLYAGGRIAAFTIGEVVGDTLFVHIEKADSSVPGAYQMIVSEYAKRNLDNGIRFINREEDVGDEGLRTSKKSYHPVGMVDKYTVTVQKAL